MWLFGVWRVVRYFTLGIWLLHVLIPTSSTWGREVGPENRRAETVESRVSKAKTQVLDRVRHSMAKTDFMWYPPRGLTIVLTQTKETQMDFQSIRIEGLTQGEILHEYSNEEQQALKSEGVHRVFSSNSVSSDQVMTFKISIKKANEEPIQFEKILPVKRESLPMITELVFIPSERGIPILVVTPVPASDLNRIHSIFSGNIKFLLETGRYLEAAVMLMNALDERGADPGVKEERQLLLAEVYLSWGLDEEAAVLLRQVATKTRSTARGAQAWFYLGKLEYQEGRYKEALEAFHKARVDLTPSLLPEILYLSGNSFLNEKAYEEAIEVLSQVPSDSSYYPFSVYSSGLAYLNQGDLSLTVAQFQKLLGIDPGQDQMLSSLIDRARMSLGFFLVDQKQFDQAIQIFGTIPRGSLYEDQTRFGIGWTYYMMGECDRAVATFEDLILEWPASTYSEEARLKIGACYSSLGAYRKAVESYQESLRFFSQRHEKLETIRQHLYRASLQDWIELQRDEFNKPESKNPLVRELSSDGRILTEISAYEDMAILKSEIEEISKSLGDTSRFDVLLNHLQQVQKQVEDEVKKSVSERILEFQSVLEERAVQADIGLLKNFNLVQ